MRKVLVIDDNPLQLSMRQAVLQSAGFSVICASSAEAALATLKDPKMGSGLELIVTDHVLPGASGAVFVRRLREFSPTVPVLVVTGMDEAEPDYAGLRVVFVHKPCAPEDFLAKVGRAVGETGKEAV
jgi:DNA-binding response OmpR family regulator